MRQQLTEELTFAALMHYFRRRIQMPSADGDCCHVYEYCTWFKERILDTMSMLGAHRFFSGKRGCEVMDMLDDISDDGACRDAIARWTHAFHVHRN